jgi:subtilisin-like proprotein convertase family protein
VPYFNKTELVEVSAGSTFAFRVDTDDGAFGAATLGVTDFQFFPAVSSFRFSGEPDLTIPDDAYDGTLDSMLCMVIDASTIPAGHRVVDLEVSLGISHSWLGDLTAKLQSPQGTVLAIVERPKGDGTNPPGDNGTGCCGDSSDINGNYPLSFRDDYPFNPEDMGKGITGFTVVCLDDGRCQFFPNPDQALVVGNSVENFASFVGEEASGEWKLCVGDSVLGDSGTLNSWSLNLIEHGGGEASITPANLSFVQGPDYLAQSAVWVASPGPGSLGWLAYTAPPTGPRKPALFPPKSPGLTWMALAGSRPEDPPHSRSCTSALWACRWASTEPISASPAATQPDR